MAGSAMPREPRLVARIHLKGVSDPGSTFHDPARRDFQHTADLPMNRSDTVRHQCIPQVNDTMLAIKTDNIDRKLHSYGMNSRGRLNPEPFLRSQLSASKQSAHPGETGIRDLDLAADVLSRAFIPHRYDAHAFPPQPQAV
nr:hypothetical protein [Silvibacterium dinghuense]